MIRKPDGSVTTSSDRKSVQVMTRAWREVSPVAAGRHKDRPATWRVSRQTVDGGRSPIAHRNIADVLRRSQPRRDNRLFPRLRRARNPVDPSIEENERPFGEQSLK